MTEQPSPLMTYYYPGWENHQRALVQSIAGLTPAHLALPIAPQQRSIGEQLGHMAGGRVAWFCGWMGESTAALDRMLARDDAPESSAADLVAVFEQTWQVIAAALARWTPADLEQVFEAPPAHQAWLQARGMEPEPPHTRQWMVWHVMEHEIHHGGELSLALGTHGLPGFYTW
jgi:uncharacterized damage-inducible protein DinB